MLDQASELTGVHLGMQIEPYDPHHQDGCYSSFAESMGSGL